MVKSLLKYIGLAFMTLMLVQVIAFAQPPSEPSDPAGDGAPPQEPDSPADASFKSRCNPVPDGHPDCASSPSECGSNMDKSPCGYTPFNCVFLEEPIGGKPGYDLFKVTCRDDVGDKCPGRTKICETTLWHGEAIVGKVHGPIQAILAYEPGKEYQGPFGLLYGYLGLVYNFLSGIIIAFVVLIAIIGGIRMTTSAGNQEQFTSGKNMIIRALIGMVVWFTASVILYTINPTFFAF